MNFGARIVDALGGRIMLTWTKSFAWTGYIKPMNKWTYFTDEEVKGLDNELVSKLDTARKVAGVPFRITSGLRTCAANTSALGVENSSHLKGLAVDLGLDAGSDRFAIVKALLGAGFVRIGVYDKHVHVDTDPDKPQSVMWVGVSH